MAIARTDHAAVHVTDDGGCTGAPRYVDARRVMYGALEVGVDLVALLVLDSLATRVEEARAARRQRRNPRWGILARNLGPVRGWIDQGLSVERIHALLERQGVHLDERVLRQYVECYTAARATDGSAAAVPAAALERPDDRPGARRVEIDLTTHPTTPPRPLALVPVLDRVRTA